MKEFDISREFCNEDCSKYVLQYLATLKYGHVIALVMEDFNAVSLGKIIAKVLYTNQMDSRVAY